MVAIVDNKGTITTREEDAKTLSDIQATKQWYIDNAYILGRTGDTGSNFYDSIVNQLDMLYKDIESGKFGDTAKTGAWYLHIKSVKDNNPKG